MSFDAEAVLKSRRANVRRWTSLEVMDRIQFALDYFARDFYGDKPFAEIPEPEQLRLLRAFESCFTSMKQVLRDEIAAEGKHRAKRTPK